VRKLLIDRNLVDHLKGKIKVELDEIPDRKTRLAHILETITSANPRFQDSHEALNIYIYIIFALVHHERYGGINHRTLGQISNLGTLILRVLNIVPRKSRLSQLYSDFYLIQSQISRNEGNHFRALWEQQMGLTHMGDVEEDLALDFHELGLGRRTLRLMQVEEAINHFDKCIALNATYKHFGQVEKLRALRLSRQDTQFHEYVAFLKTERRFMEEFPSELTWNIECMAVSQGKDLLDLILMTKKDARFADPSFYIEAYFWNCSHHSVKYSERFKNIKSIVTTKISGHSQLLFWGKCARQIYDCYKGEFSVLQRLSDLSGILNDMDKLVNLEKVLLLLVASTRWLMRTKQPSLAAVTAQQYRSLSKTISEGRSENVLGLLGEQIADAAGTPLGRK
jgi:hypothetical protein